MTSRFIHKTDWFVQGCSNRAGRLYVNKTHRQNRERTLHLHFLLALRVGTDVLLANQRPAAQAEVVALVRAIHLDDLLALLHAAIFACRL